VASLICSNALTNCEACDRAIDEPAGLARCRRRFCRARRRVFACRLGRQRSHRDPARLTEAFAALSSAMQMAIALLCRVDDGPRGLGLMRSGDLADCEILSIASLS